MWNWVKRVVGIFTGSAGAGRSMMAGVMNPNGDPPIRGSREFLETYDTMPYVRAVAGRVSGSVGATRWQLEARGREVPEDHIFLRVLRAPNSMMTGHDLFKITQLHLDLVGDAFWLKVRNGLRAPVEFWPIPPHWVMETPTPDRPQYRVSYAGWQGIFPDTEIAWASDPSPSNPYARGAGIVRAQADELETHEFASKHAKQLFFNRATPEFVVMDDGAGDPELARHEQHWMQRLQGYWRNNKPYFVNRKLEFWQPQQMNLENLTMVPLMKHERDVILQTWGMPPEQLGILENSNRATIDASDYVYEARLIRPRREFLRAFLQARLAPEYDERLIVGYVDTVPEDKAHQLNVAKAAPHTLNVDEWRVLVGLKPVGGELGRARMVPLNSYLAADPLDPKQRPQAGGSAARSTDAPPPTDVEEQARRAFEALGAAQ